MPEAKDYTAEAKRHRHQADQYRMKAELMADDETRAQYLRLAESHDALAASAEQLVRNLKSVGNPN